MKNETKNEAPVKKRNSMDVVKTILSVLFIILVTFQIGVAVGWNMRSADYGRTQNEANTIVQSLKAAGQK